MKGVLFRHRSMVGFARLRNVLTVVIQGKNNLAISLFEDRITAHFGFEVGIDFENLGEVEIPDELVKVAVNFAIANEKMLEAKEQFQLIMEG